MKRKLLENLIKYPILFYVFYFIYTIRPPFKLMIFSADKYESLLHYVLILWGIAIVIYNFFKKRELFLRENRKFILMWAIASILTVIYNISYITTNSIKSILLTMLSIVFFLIGYPLLRGKYSHMQIFKCIFYPVLSVKIIINAISIYLYMDNISIFIIRDDLLDFLGVRYVGISGGKYTPLLYGLYKDPNFTAMMGVSLIFIAGYIYISFKNGLSYKEKVFIYSSIILEFIMVSFSNSRGTLYSIILVALIIVILIILNNYFMKKTVVYVTLKKILIICLITILFVVSYVCIQKGGFLVSQNNHFERYIYAKDNNRFVRIFPSDLEKEQFLEHKGWILEYDADDEENEKKSGKITIAKEDSGEEVGNGRITIWRDTIKLFLKRPLFGISPEMQKIFSNEKYNYLDVPSMKEGRSIHNSYLAVLLYYGVMGGVILAVVFIKRLYPLFVEEVKNGYSSKSVLLYAILFCLIASFFLESIFVNIDFEQIYLMFLLGTVTKYSEEKGED